MKQHQWLLAVMLIIFSAAAVAQQEKAYAPEDLTRLTQPEQVRVLEKQYAELSGGRQLPEDQLEFYLEQIPRGWSYAQITQDMAQSLRDRVDGNTYPDQLPPPTRPGRPDNDRPGWGTPGWSHQFPDRRQGVRCASEDRRYTECATGFRNPPQIDQQLSSARCVEGRTWGHRPGVIWVAGGCRATFVESAPQLGELPEITCRSTRGYRECNVAFRGPAELLRQISGSSLCVEGRTWGQRPGLIWVDRGCGGIFAEGYRSSGGYYNPDEYNRRIVDCASLDGHYAICSWDPRDGEPVLVQQFSSQACIEGVTWGHSARRGLWVDRGCRGRFGSRRDR
ncbi:MAG: DUF3011 domain-containing protein [Xanthomonadales bacterium]|nr:DUF3011 domain-containing protein [Xanthomonadales bacterium]